MKGISMEDKLPKESFEFPKRVKVTHEFPCKSRKVGSVHLDEEKGESWFLVERTPTCEIWELQE